LGPAITLALIASIYFGLFAVRHAGDWLGLSLPSSCLLPRTDYFVRPISFA